MKNLFQKLSSATTSLKQKVVAKSSQLTESIKNKVMMLTAATAIGISQSAIAADWKKVDTPGIGPRAFAEQNFGTKEWRGNLIGEDGQRVINPATDLILGKKYTLQNVRKEEVIVPQKEETIQSKAQDVIILKKETKKTPHEITPTNVSFGDIMQLDGFKDFDFQAYYEAIGRHESNGKITARNDKTGKKLGVKPGKFAFGWPQFTVDTLKGYGVHLVENGEIIESRVQTFLNNRELQDKLMEKYTQKSLNQIRKNPKIVELIQSGVVSLPAMLAKGHIAGHGSINMNWGGEDWLGTSVKKYAKNVESRYMKLAQNSSQIVEETIPELRKNSNIINPELTIPQSSTVISSTPAANDEKFETPATVEKIALNTTSVVQDIQTRKQSSQYTMLMNKRDTLIQEATKLEKKADRLEQDARSIVGESWGKRKFIIDIRKYREEAQKLRKHAHTINLAITPIDKSKKAA